MTYHVKAHVIRISIPIFRHVNFGEETIFTAKIPIDFSEQKLQRLYCSRSIAQWRGAPAIAWWRRCEEGRGADECVVGAADLLRNRFCQVFNRSSATDSF